VTHVLGDVTGQPVKLDVQGYTLKMLLHPTRFGDASYQIHYDRRYFRTSRIGMQRHRSFPDARDYDDEDKAQCACIAEMNVKLRNW
jgi:hypothetical protein